MSGAKTWEIRGNSCPHLGLIALYKVGCKRIVGMVRIVESKLLQDEELSWNIEKHCIADWSRNDFVRILKKHCIADWSRNGVYAWVMANPIAIEPIYGSWVCLWYGFFCRDSINYPICLWLLLHKLASLCRVSVGDGSSNVRWRGRVSVGPLLHELASAILMRRKIVFGRC